MNGKLEEGSLEIIKSIEKLEKEIEQLESYKIQCIKDNYFGEAEEINKQIKKLKDLIFKNKKKSLANQHTVELSSLSEKLQSDLNELEREWDNKLKIFEDKSRELREELKNKQENEAIHFQENIEAKFKNPKLSKKTLQLKDQLDKLIKLQMFKDAEFINKKLQISEKNDLEQFNKQRHDRMQINIENLKSKQETENAALNNKIDIEHEILARERELAREHLNNIYKTRKCSLNSQQKQEKKSKRYDDEFNK